MLTSIQGIPVDDLAQWGEPYHHMGELIRTARPNRLAYHLYQRFPDKFRHAGIQYRKTGGTSYFVQVLVEMPQARVLREERFAVEDASSIQINEAGLLEWQPAAVRQLCHFWHKGERGLLDGSDTGVGKSYVALALARELRRHAFVVCPKGAISQWREAAKQMGTPCEAINWEQCKTNNHRAIKWKVEKRMVNGEVKDIRYPDWRLDKQRVLLIFDEAQNGKSPDFTLASKLMLWAKYRGIPCMMLSATLATSPLFMRAAGYILGLHKNTDFPEWLMANGCFQVNNEWFFTQKPEYIQAMHKEIFTRCGVRVRKKDLGDKFPQTVIEPILVEIDENVAARYAGLTAKLKEHRERTADFAAKGGFAEIQGLRQEVELQKIPLAVEMAEDALDEGLAVCIFMNFTETIREVAKQLKNTSIIWGLNKEGEREQFKKQFQDDSIPCIVVNNDSGGTALSLHGKKDRLVIIMPTFKADVLRQIFGRCHRAGGSKSVQRVLFAKGTIEEDIYANVRAKLDNLDLLNDGDTTGNLIMFDKTVAPT